MVKVAGVRDKLIHFYFRVRLEIVWTVSTKEIPELEKNITAILGKTKVDYELKKLPEN